jgi:hypothetical protein
MAWALYWETRDVRPDQLARAQVGIFCCKDCAESEMLVNPEERDLIVLSRAGDTQALATLQERLLERQQRGNWHPTIGREQRP